MTSAVSDYSPKFPQVGKIKKRDIGDEWKIELKKNPDILKEIDKEGLVTIGFKAEMDENNGLSNAKSMLESKNIDGVCFNLLKNSDSFGTETNSIIFITRDKEVDLGRLNKLELSFKILDESKFN